MTYTDGELLTTEIDRVKTDEYIGLKFLVTTSFERIKHQLMTPVGSLAAKIVGFEGSFLLKNGLY
jgi:hypothetical protein